MPLNESESLPQQVGLSGLGVFTILALPQELETIKSERRKWPGMLRSGSCFPEFAVQVRHSPP